MTSQTFEVVPKWALILFDVDGCTMVVKTSAIHSSGSLSEGDIIVTEIGKVVYKVEILKLADLKSEINQYETEWQISSRSDAISTAKDDSMNGGYLDVAEDQPELAEDSFLQYFEGVDLGTIATPQPIPQRLDVREELNRLREQQEVIVCNQAEMKGIMLDMLALLNVRFNKRQRIEMTAREDTLQPVTELNTAPTVSSGENVSCTAIVARPPILKEKLQSEELLATALTPPLPEVTSHSNEEPLTTINAEDIAYSIQTPSPKRSQPTSSSSINIGSSRHPLYVEKDRFSKAKKMPTAKRFILGMMDHVFSKSELASSNIDGGMVKYGGQVMEKNKLSEGKLSAIYRQAALLYGIREEEIRGSSDIRNAINAKCRAKRQAFGTCC